jgi:hypothetical protein
LNHTYGNAIEMLQIKENQLQLKFDDYLFANQYVLTFEQIKGLASDSIYREWFFSFDLSRPTPAGAIVVNELMPDPNPKGLVPANPVLPDAEFIELFNSTDKPIRLDAFTCSEAAVPQVTLNPQDYLILCRAEDQPFFQRFGQVAGMESFKTLVNSGGEVYLRDGFGNLIDSITYDRSLYRDSAKENGGWSVERINPFLTCSDPNNWEASRAMEGGTPGALNERFSEAADQRPFEVLEIFALSSDRIRVTFSKILPAKLATAPAFYLNGQELELLELNRYSVILEAIEPMVSGDSYQLDINNLQDCNGLGMEEEVLSFTYDGSPPMVQNIWGLDENTLVLVFDEAIDPDAAVKAGKYQVLETEGISIAANISEEAHNEVQLSLSAPLVIQEIYQLRVAGLADLSGNQMIPDTLSFKWEDVLDTVMVQAANTLKVKFSVGVRLEAATNPGNYRISSSVTRPIRVLEDLQAINTFLLVFAAEFPENQELDLIVRGIQDKEEKSRITLKKAFIRDTRNISLEQLEIPSDQSLLLTFNKALDPKWALLPQVYRIEENSVPPGEIEMPEKHQVLLQFPFPWETGKEYRLRIDGLEDLYGKKMSRPISRSFIWDTLAPVIDTAYLSSPYALEIIWSKPMERPDAVLVNDQLYSNFEVSDGGRQFTVKNDQSLTPDLLEVKLPKVISKSGEVGENIHFTVDNSLLAVANARIWDEQSIQVTFTQFYDPAKILFSEQYQIDGESPEEVVPENPYQVRLVLAASLRPGDQVAVQITPLQPDPETLGNVFQKELGYDDGISDWWLENQQVLLINHDAALHENQAWLDEFHFLEEGHLVEAFLSQTYPNQIQVLISPPLPEGLQLTLKIPPRLLNSERLLPGSLREISWHPLPPKLLEVVVLPDNQIALYFDKKLDPILAMVPQFYSIGDQSPQTAQLEDNGKEVLLAFETTWSAGNPLTLEILQLEDLDGNEIDPVAFEFVYQEVAVPGYKDLVINEIMPAPREGNGLPATEYIEIFNPTNTVFNLGGMKIANSRNQSALPREELKPGEYLLLCPLSSVASLASFGKVIGLNHWPVLLNGGDALSLYNHKGELVDQMQYGPEIPLAGEVLNNGYSLELVNPWSTCEVASNYAPSRSGNKGTPGLINSVFDDSPDRTAPRLLSAFVRNKNEIILQFSKPSAVESGNPEDFQIEPGVKIDSVRRDPQDQFQWILHLEEVLEENTSYQISVNNWRDCSGNALDRDSNIAHIKIPALAAEGDIVLNEILFNPPTGAPKFVEIYNNSSRLINLKNWKLANASADGQPDNRKIITSQDLIMEPYTYLVLTTDIQSLVAYFPKAANHFILEMSLPSYTIRSGTVILLDPEERWQERFDYDEDYHHGFIRDAKGISLERYALTAPANDPKNWHSAAASENFATPGYKNSQVYEGNEAGVGLTLSPEVFVPSAAGEQPFTTISYQMDQPNYQATLRIFTPTGVQVRILCQNEIWAANGFYTWDGTNEKGEQVGPGYYIISAELFHPDGQVQHIKKTVVVGTKF